MKKLISLFTALVICLSLMVPLTASAASASASLTGPGTVRAGDTITLNFSLSGSGLSGASGNLTYDSNQVSLVSTKQKIASPWMVEFNGGKFVAYDNNLSSPIKGSKTLFAATFKVKNVSAGTKITISCTDVTASDGTADANVGTVRYTATVAAPLSGENKLSSLKVGNATISPAFSPATTYYTASVPFDVSRLQVTATAADSKATVSVSNTNLSAGMTTNVTITVKAENGAKKVYTIAVRREADPNYEPSDNNKLSGISVEGFLLSPVFNPEVTKYVVWLPYETDNVKVSGTAADGKASVFVSGGENLLAGQDNTITVTCTAENGSKRVYTVIAKRAAAHDGTVDEPLPSESIFDETEYTSDDTVDKTEEKGGVPIWALILVGVVCLGAGIGGGIVIDKKSKR